MTPKNSPKLDQNRAENHPKFDSKLGQNAQNNTSANIH